VDEDRGQHLVVVGNVAGLVPATQAVIAVDLLGPEVFDAVQGHQVTAFEEDIPLQDLATLQLAEDILEDRAEAVGVNVVEDGPHLGIAGDGLKAEDSAEVVIDGAMHEGEQGRVLEGEQRQTGHQRVGRGEVRIAAWLREFLEALADEANEGIKVQVAALMP
jgi:hypothetical protein